jgi:hypothetical protein
MKHSGQWPGDLLDIAAVQKNGFRLYPFREFVLKVHQRRNLACDYCYVYTMADQTWRSQPVAMSAEVWQAAARRIAEHVRTHSQGLHLRLLVHAQHHRRDRRLQVQTHHVVEFVHEQRVGGQLERFGPSVGTLASRSDLTHYQRAL